ncbi:MAG: hypothetical protein U5K27_10115 [Desulfotignum sp.]|nr:hypothetical protein [Desulfotignum sp.]
MRIYFGTDVLYLGYLSRFLAPDGMLGVVMPALMQKIGDVIPDHLTRPQANGKVFWEDGCRSFKTADWWQELWAEDSSVTDARMEILPDGWRLWRDFETALEMAGKSIFPSDAGHWIWIRGGISGLSGERPGGPGPNP